MRALCRILPTMAAMLASLCAFADRVPEQKAAETAAAFFLQSDVKFSTAVRAVASRRSTEVPAYRAYNREGGGFVVIAGDDSVEPILAYSPDGVFPSEEEMPENMAWWFGMIADQIKSIPAGRKASAEIKARWEAPASSFRSASNLLYDTATWGQRAPFNNLCPESGGERCVAGCEAVAGATIARYYRWPDRGVGTVDANIWSDSPDYPAHDLGYEYDYDNMPLEYGRNYTTEQANAVATLVYDMGTVAKMSYGVKGSFTYDMYLLEGLKNHMKYNRSAYLAKRKVYSDEQWISLLKEHLDEYGPTVYSGADSGGAGGHAFVIDGYDEQDRFHFNWGWNGSSNCYCIITEMVPTGQPYNFINDQSVMIDLIPDRDGSSVIRDILYFSGDERYSGITANTDSFSQNVSFNCNCGWIASMTGAFEGKFCLALYDKYGNFKQDISGTIEITIQPNKMRGFSCTCTIT